MPEKSAFFGTILKGRARHMRQRCIRFKAGWRLTISGFIGRFLGFLGQPQCSQPRNFLPDGLGVGLILYHGLGALSGSFFLFERCFGAGVSGV
jgi:uncharacterized membrane protein YfcA